MVGNVAYTTSLNSSAATFHVSFGELAWVRGLSWGLHSCDIAVQTTRAQVVVTELLILTGIPDAVLRNGPGGARTKVHAVQPNKMLTADWSSHQANGSPWEVNQPFQGGHGESTSPFKPEEQGSFPAAPDYYYVLRTNTSGSSVTYKVPPRTSFIELWGTAGWGFANYTVTFTPTPPFSPPNGPYVPFSPYYSPNQVLSFTVLDPSITYSLRVDTVSDGTMEVYAVQYFTDNGTTVSTHSGGTSTGISVGALAGGIVGGLLGGAAICAVIGLVVFNQYKRRNKPVSAGRFIVDHPEVDPFPQAEPAPGTLTFRRDHEELVPLMPHPDMTQRESVMTSVTGERDSGANIIIQYVQPPAPPVQQQHYAGPVEHVPPAGIPIPQQVIYSLPVNSLIVRFSPPATGLTGSAWNLTYSETPTSGNFTPGAIGVGQPRYAATTSAVGGSSYTTVAVEFVGTGIALVGTGSPADHTTWQCDALNSSNTDRVGTYWLSELAYARNLDWGLHSCVFNIFSTAQTTVQEVLLLTGMQGGLLVNGHAGGYSVLRAESRVPYTTFLQVDVPPGASFVELYGSIGAGFADYTITITPAPPFNPPATTRYSANSPYYAPWQILGFAVLDPGVSYTLRLESSTNGWLEIYNIAYLTAQ
ncbi:uncharacterized protein LOC62_06G007896 [Vanrija pseudolonga]|uniref:Uncharacterized protein n=1 Tax=Vanrija pseudolonga TaxID=143232 RepID=A0AAF1BKV3_9TREE|nr:hypothetical protein LOC62_06G007896 [Vanrija pseudolonga]